MTHIALSIITSGLAIGTIITMTSHHWILAWMGLEINTLAIIPLIIKNHHPRAVEAATKYFFTQCAASALILFSNVLNSWLTGQWAVSIDTYNSTQATFLAVAIAMKLGIAPFHLWFCEVLQGVPYGTGVILATWQKLAPLALLIKIAPYTNLNLMVTLGVISMVVGGWGGINQTQIRKILAFSSTAHLGWVLVILKFSTTYAMLNFGIYLLLTLTLFFTFMVLASTHMSQLAMAWSKVPSVAALALMVLLSLAGLPPTTGFLPKLLISAELIKQGMPLLTLTILMSTLLSFFFYLRLVYVVAINAPANSPTSTPKWMYKKKNILALPLMASLLLFPLAPLVVSLFNAI
uniref:NADH-ubiquinone oxidoreductase chain 2 n=1 Tax=Bokermannohyla alvarengai TaxID=1513809 RepID=A0A343RF59_BOKAL|nr:NADH dehydrogenase subunit 2 [Bokermannohyla alvarengai]ATY40976.1 NADH dehydrogenase subunit 2 [Bokermannohyla alvarengai]